VCCTVLVVEGVGCVEMGVGIGLPPCFWVACGVAPCTGGVVFADTVGIVVRVAAKVGEGVGVVGVGVCRPGGVLVGFTANIGADDECEASACAFTIPSTAPMQERRRKTIAHAALRARETVDLATLERVTPLMIWLLNCPYSDIREEGDEA